MNPSGQAEQAASWNNQSPWVEPFDFLRFDGSPNLAKAEEDDHYLYAVGLTTGLVFVCRGVVGPILGGQFVTLLDAQPTVGIHKSFNGFTFGRGLDVRLSEIAWVGDNIS